MPVSAPRTQIISAALLLTLLAGCSAPDSRAPERGNAAQLSITDFQGAAPVPSLTPTSPTTNAGNALTPAPAPTNPTDANPRRGGRAVVISDADATAGLSDVVVLSGQPENAIRPEARPASASPYLVDAMIGQINGKPVYASRFLAPLDGVLRAKADEAKSPQAWATEARNIIAKQLANEIEDELLLAESRAALSPEQRQGLVFFVQQIRDNLAAQNSGSEARAEEAALAQEGLTLDQKVREEQNKALIRSLVERSVRPRVNVSWRDVQRQYERDFRVFNPLPTANLRMIFVPTKNVEGVQKIREAIAAGTPFAALAAAEPNTFARGDSGLLAPPRSFEPPLANAKVFDDPILNQNAQKLSPGQVTEPFELGQNTVWIKLDTINETPSRSLEQVQLEIQSALRNQKFNQELQRFYNRILERGSRTSEDEMLRSLLLIAAERYLIGSKIRPSGANTMPIPAPTPASKP